MTTEEWLDLIRLYDKDKTTVKDFCSATVFQPHHFTSTVGWKMRLVTKSFYQ